MQDYDGFDDFDDLGPPLPQMKLAAILVLAAICGGIAICVLGATLCSQPVKCPGQSVDPAPSIAERSVLVKQ